MGVVAAAGSFGQFLMIPGGIGQLINGMGWFGTLLIFAAGALLIMPLGGALTRGPRGGRHARARPGARPCTKPCAKRATCCSTWAISSAASRWCSSACTSPPTCSTRAWAPEVGMTCLALIGLFNVFGSYGAGYLGNRAPKRLCCRRSTPSRSVAIALFLWAPLTPASAYLFAATMGLLWLSTVPLTNAIVAQVFGVRYLGMLSGLVFFSHQVGSFLGVWLGGKLFDATGSYNTIWGICILLGVVAALMPPADRRAQPGSHATFGHDRLTGKAGPQPRFTGQTGPNSGAMRPASTRFPAGANEIDR
jgi:predicted MFS family arabinose efflux permease